MKETGKILAVLCATQETEGLKRSIESLRRHGIEMYVYGMGQTWEGNGMKQVADLNAAEKFQGKFDYILSLDGYDTLCLADEDEVLSKFMAFQNPMVICAEMNCWPNSISRDSRPPASEVLWPPSNAETTFLLSTGNLKVMSISYSTQQSMITTRNKNHWHKVIVISLIIPSRAEPARFFPMSSFGNLIGGRLCPFPKIDPTAKGHQESA